MKDNPDTISEKRLEVNFYPVLKGDSSHGKIHYNGNIGVIKKVFVFNQKYKNKKNVNLLAALSSEGEGLLVNYNKCLVKVRNGVVSLGLYSANGSDKVQLMLPESFSYLATEDEKNAQPVNKNVTPAKQHEPIDTAAIDTSIRHESAQDSSINRETYTICLVGDIDSPKFPQNPRLLSFLKNNNDFIFRLSMDLYLDILRFNAASVDYDREKIVNFLSIHDLMYMRYGFNEISLNKKVVACEKLLRRVNAVYTKGDVFYKDYTMELNRQDVETNPLVLAQNEPKKGDYYFNGQRVKGHADRFYTDNGLNVFLTNWTYLSSPAMRSTEETYLSCLSNKSQPLTLRIYFMVQPYGVYSKKGIFKGVTAYGLKGILFADCPSNYVCCIDNQDAIKKVQAAIDTLARQTDSLAVYKEAFTYLQNRIRHSGINQSVNPKTIYGDGYYPLGNWQQNYQDCQTGYSFWSGSVTRLPNKQALVSFKMLTNYQCPLQAGYDLTFTNRHTDVSFLVHVASASLTTNETSGDYYIVTAKVADDMLRKMLDAKVNSVTCQCLGSASPSPQTLLRSNVISHAIERLSAPIEVNESGDCEMLSSLLKTGL